MPCAVDYILEGLAENLELEKELGGFSLEFDRDFLATLPKERTEGSRISDFRSQRVAERGVEASHGMNGTQGTQGTSGINGTHGTQGTQGTSGINGTHGTEKSAALEPPLFDYVFLHHGPITGPGVEMMAKLVVAMKKTPETAPIVFTGEKPPAKIYVVLGTKALAKWYDGVSLAYGGWFKDVSSEVLLVYSPEDIYRFGTNLSPAMIQKKREMWKSLQEAMRKV